MAEVVLVFSWKGAEISVQWPPHPHKSIKTPRPGRDIIHLAAPMSRLLPRMLPHDRKYLSAFYDAMAFVLIKDGQRQHPIIETTDHFHNFHSGSIRLSTDSVCLGRYDGLLEASQESFVNAVGPQSSTVDDSVRVGLVAACGVLSYVTEIHREE